MTELRSLGCYACIDKRVRSKGKQGNKSTGRAATHLKATKRTELMDVARAWERVTRSAENAKARKCGKVQCNQSKLNEYRNNVQLIASKSSYGHAERSSKGMQCDV
jgi:hypothetical protein